MTPTDGTDYLDAMTRTCQVIVAGLIMAASTLFALALALLVIPASAMKAQGMPENLLTYLALAIGAANLALSFVVPGIVAANGRKQIAREVPAKTSDAGKPARLVDGQTDTPRLAILYQTQLIVGAALLEGAAFFACIAYMFERQPIALGVAVVLIAVMASRIPTRDRLAAWIDGQAMALQEDRRLLF
ncbi:hypothetical protein [Aquisphaera insulae]|uniref:hypothetical protein n=1 Tax=Aquisphaera insulae TaxID=2712864 RepID=UPI0013EDB069|nr:hypothetical protein [Aquisphaera insulae]